jgi:hypothetical protein
MYRLEKFYVLVLGCLKYTFVWETIYTLPFGVNKFVRKCFFAIMAVYSRGAGFEGYSRERKRVRRFFESSNACTVLYTVH